MKKTPRVSIIVPTYNEEANIKKCLESIFIQSYPEKELEVIVVDDNSTDRTVEIAREHPVKIIKHNNNHGEIGKMIGFRKATGEYAVYIDADIELKGKNWFQKMIQPMEEHEKIMGSFTRFYSRETDPPLERYYSMDPLQRDTIYRLFSPDLEDLVIEAKKEYSILKYTQKNIPPAGLVMYRRKELLKVVKDYEMFLELDFLVLMVKNGFEKFAYVPKAGLYHHHVANIKELIRKRRYNVKNVYLKTYKRKLYKWFKLGNLVDLVKIFLLIIYSNTIIPGIIVGLYKSIKHQDWAGMYEPIVSLLVTDLIIYSFLTDYRTLNVIKPK